MSKLFNRVAVNTETTGTGAITLGSASGLWLSPDEAGVANGDKVTYVITEGSDFELGRGTYAASGTMLSRDTVLASKIAGVAGTAKMDLQGDAMVAFTAAAEDLPESGSNANGRYVRFPDGTQICTHAMKAEYVDASKLAASWTFPMPFAGGADYSWTAMMQRRSPTNVSEGIVHANFVNSVVREAIHGPNLMVVEVHLPAPGFSAGAFVWLSLTAIGRWY